MTGVGDRAALSTARLEMVQEPSPAYFCPEHPEQTDADEGGKQILGSSTSITATTWEGYASLIQ